MDDTLNAKISTAVTLWARETYQTEEIVIADVSQDEEEPERYLVILAVRPLDYWLTVEVWLNDDDDVEAVNGLGEGLPLEDADWPWPEGHNEGERWG
jgi:hypothetical protein